MWTVLDRRREATLRSDGSRRKLRISQNIAVSCVSASLAHVPHHPLYTLKTQMMFHGKRFRLRNFLTMAWESRGTFLMRGVMVRSIGIAPEKALKMVAWDGGMYFANYAYPQCPKGLQWAFGGALAGAATTIIGCPSERTMVLAQVRGETFWEIVRSRGVRALYNGAMATLYRDISFNCCLFVTRAFVMKKYEDRTGAEPGPYRKIWYGLPSSILAGVVACPFDVVKTRIQGVTEGGEVRPLLRMYQIARTEGIRQLYKGLLPRLIAVPLYMSVFITVNEELQKYILGRRIVS
ncbi:Mitochondrial substrate carrier family protein X [Geodia barretti]|uniref:Mitochondrial substrate carrier family protein X n=1 Tax=Geodia barretti TaxID=519541 RepID=A0AA35T466_GEOBA|nr:Mitochondrial substrate carrier family protein X [Geodia barretti]